MRLRRRGHLGLSLACLLAVVPVTLALAHADTTHTVELPVIVLTYLATVAALALASRVAAREGCRLMASIIAMGAVVVLAAGALEGAFAVRESTDVTLTVATRPVHVADSWAGTVCGDGPYTLELPRNGRIAHPTITVDALTARDAHALDIIWEDTAEITLTPVHGLAALMSEQAGLTDETRRVLMSVRDVKTHATALVPGDSIPRRA